MKGYNEMHLSQESMREVVQGWINKSYTVYNPDGTRRQVQVSGVRFNRDTGLFVVDIHGGEPKKEEATP